jgi:hypothetical protein
MIRREANVWQLRTAAIASAWPRDARGTPRRFSFAVNFLTASLS